MRWTCRPANGKEKEEMQETTMINGHQDKYMVMQLNSRKGYDCTFDNINKGISLTKSLSSYSCTEGEKYFRNPKGQTYFYTRTGNRHVLMPTKNVLKGKRSHGDSDSKKPTFDK